MFPDSYDTHEQTDLAQEWANGFDMGYRQAEDDLMATIQDMEATIFELQDMVQEILAKRN